MARFNPFQQDENALPPEKVQILDLHVEPWPDGKRVRVHITLTPFQQPPDLELTIYNGQKQEVSHVTVVENIDDKLVLTMHLRVTDPQGDYVLEANVSYNEIGTVTQGDCGFVIPGETEPDL